MPPPHATVPVPVSDTCTNADVHQDSPRDLGISRKSQFSHNRVSNGLRRGNSKVRRAELPLTKGMPWLSAK
jgi:hypothetical protein